MLDIQFIRDNPEAVTKQSEQKGYKVDVAKLLKLDEDRRKLVQEVEDLRRQRNELTAQTKGQKPSDEQVKKGKDIKDEIAAAERKLGPVNEPFTDLLKEIQ